jgi:Animal haem peroxidase
MGDARPSLRRRSAQTLGRAAERIDATIGWSRLPSPLGIPVLVGLRYRLRAENLYDTGRDAGKAPPPVHDGRYRIARSVDGTYNDLTDPLMGATGCRFGRNVPLDAVHREDDEALLSPNPSVISRRLLRRKQFQPATTLNLLAAAWIQFEVHDWLSHPTVDDQPWQIASQDEQGKDRVMMVKRTKMDPGADPDGPPTFVTDDTHWWDGSQIYGGKPEFADALRSLENGKLQIDDLGLPPAALEARLPTGVVANFWVGLALLHSLFMREHNAICDVLVGHYPHLTDQELYDKARLINAALMAKIHTIDWTPAIIAHPTTTIAMRANWFGVFGERLNPFIRRFTSNEVFSGIPGSPTDHHDVPYSLTEEFVAVYRMHPLLPDDYEFRSSIDDSLLNTHTLVDLEFAKVRERLTETSMVDLLYSFGRAHPGAITLHNYPVGLTNLVRGDDEIDLAAVDVLRVRERGVPRYNEFRRLFRLKPAATFADLTDDPVWARELEEVYGDVERVDLIVGMYAEPKPPGFGFSDTAFRVFILMASRRLESDRFFTKDFRPEVYTPAGMDWIRRNSMRTVLLRHFPELAPALSGVKNPFAPWTAASSTDQPTGADMPTRTYVPFREDVEQPRIDEAGLVHRIAASLNENNVWALKKYRHGIRDAHAKGHGLLRGELTVYPDLPGELRQGLFAEPASYPVVARLSSTAGAMRSDQTKGIRGLGIKVLGVSGPKILPDDDTAIQDFILVTHREFPFPDAAAYLKRGMPLAKVLSRTPDSVLQFASRIFAFLGNRILPRVGLHLPMALQLFARPNSPVLGESYFSSSALRFGDYIARFAVVPLSESVRSLQGQVVPSTAGDDAHRDMVVDLFRTDSAEYEFQVQLCTDLTTMPVEDASVDWPEDASPHRGVAKLTFPVQNPATKERITYGDDVLSFNSWRGLAAHRPLGSINRLKKLVYDASSDFRHEHNGVPRREPSDVSELPE